MRRLGIVLVVIAGGLAAILASAVVAYRIAYPGFTHRLRLTVEIQDGRQVRSGSGVIEVTWQSQPGIANSPWHCSIKGDAVLIDLGSGRRVTAILRQVEDRGRREWRAGLCTVALLSYGLGAQQSLDTLNALARKKGRVEVDHRAMPTFVIFTDESDPESAVVVRPADFPSMLQGAQLARVWVELTDQPVTRGVVSTVPAVATLIGNYAGSRNRPGVFRAWGTDFSQPLQSQASTPRQPPRRPAG